MKHLKKYNESLAESSKNDLESFKIDLEFINRYDIHSPVVVIYLYSNLFKIFPSSSFTSFSCPGPQYS